MASAKKDVPGQTTVTMRADRGKLSGAPTIGHSDTVVMPWRCLCGGLPDEEKDEGPYAKGRECQRHRQSVSWAFGKITWCY